MDRPTDQALWELEEIRGRAEAMHAYYHREGHDKSLQWQSSYRDNRLKWLLAERDLQHAKRRRRMN